MHIGRWSLLAGAVLVLFSLEPFIFAPTESFSGYALLPGIIIGMYASAAISGYPHGVELAPMLIIASVVNFFFWTIVCYAVLSVYFRFHHKSDSKK
jgi:hypothetical protein